MGLLNSVGSTVPVGLNKSASINIMSESFGFVKLGRSVYLRTIVMIDSFYDAGNGLTG